MKLREWMYQAATKVNVLSHEISSISEADTVSVSGRQQRCNVKARKQRLCRGQRQWHGTKWKICELGRSTEFLNRRYAETSPKEQGSADDSVEVGLTDSTPRAGKPSTWGSGQQRCDSSNNNADAPKSGRQRV